MEVREWRACATDGEEKKYLDVIWYNISERSSFCSNLSCMVENPIRIGSRRPTRQLLMSTPFFCRGFISVGFANSRRSFRAPTKTAQKVNLNCQKCRNVKVWEQRECKSQNLRIVKTSIRSLWFLPACGMLTERMVLTFPSQPSTLIPVAVENSSAGPTHRRDLKYTLVKC